MTLERCLAALALALVFTQPASAAGWASKAEREANVERERAWESVKNAAMQRDDLSAIATLNGARARARAAGWDGGPSIAIYEVKETRQGVARMYRLVKPKRWPIARPFDPDAAIYSRLERLLSKTKRRVAALPPGDRQARLLGLSAPIKAALQKLETEGLDRARLESYESSLGALSERQASAAPKTPSRSESELQRRRLELRDRWRAAAQVEGLRIDAALGRARALLCSGALPSAVALIDSSRSACSALRASTPEALDSIAALGSSCRALQRHARAMLAVTSPSLLEGDHARSRARGERGLAAAQAVGATGWARIRQRRLAQDLIARLTCDPGRWTVADLESWREIFPDTLAATMLRLELEDRRLLGLTSQAWTRPQAPGGTMTRYVIARSSQALAVVEEDYESRKARRSAEPETRRERLEELTRLYEELSRCSHSDLPATLRKELSDAGTALERELTRSPYSLFTDKGRVLERLAGYLGALPKLGALVSRPALARAELATGLGAMYLQRKDEDWSWLVRQALARDLSAAKDLPRALIPDWLQAELSRMAAAVEAETKASRK